MDFTVHGIFQARILEWVAPPGDLPNPVYIGVHLMVSNKAGMHLKDKSGSDGKESACSTGSLGSIPGSGRSPGEGNGNTLHYSCLENSLDRGA